MAEKPKSKTAELVKTNCQSTKGQMEEEFRTDASFEEIVERVLSPVDNRRIERPTNRRVWQ